MNRARQAVDRYVEAVNAKDLKALEGLFTDEAVLLPPSADPLEGKQAVLGYYRDLVFVLGPSARAARHVTDGDTCAVELEATIDGTVGRFADFFTVGDDGRVVRLAIYAS